MKHSIQQNVLTIAESARPPEIEASPEAIGIAVHALRLVAKDYGPNSTAARSYHNVPHGIDVMRRGVRLANLLHPHISEEHQTGLQDLIVVGTSCHDVEQGLGTYWNEHASALYAVDKSREYGNAFMKTASFTDRLYEGIMVTEVDRQPDGRIIQNNLQKGEPDPYKFIMAFADINGIAMEGPTRMLRDATNLCFEVMDNPTVEQWYSFLTSQVTFLRQRLNDHQVKGDIAYHFPEHQDDVYKLMRHAFHRNIISAHRTALAISERPELVGPMTFAAKRIDQSGLGKFLIRAMR